ncbi:MAG: hypothetical protein ACTSXU_12640, partial [Promethearchaeota archaeon]
IAAIASMLCSEGHVFIVESSEEVLEMTQKNLMSTGFDSRITVVHGNPLTMAGIEDFGKWDKILIPYQVEEKEIYPALSQLNEDGVLFAPIGNYSLQFFTQIIKHDNKFYGNKITMVLFSPLEKNVSFLSQQVEYLEMLKKVNILDDIGDVIDYKIKTTRQKLLERRQKLDVSDIDIIYDSEFGEQLHENYKKELVIEIRDEENMDFYIIENIAVELAKENGGKIRLLTIANKIGIPIEALQVLLKRSKKGSLEKDPSDIKSMQFVLIPSLLDQNPLVLNFLSELDANLMLIDGHVEKENFKEIHDIVDFTIKKAKYVEQSSKYPMKKIIYTLNNVKSDTEICLDLLEDDAEKSKKMIEKLKNEMLNSLKSLKHIVKTF